MDIRIHSKQSENFKIIFSFNPKKYRKAMEEDDKFRLKPLATEKQTSQRVVYMYINSILKTGIADEISKKITSKVNEKETRVFCNIVYPEGVLYPSNPKYTTFELTNIPVLEISGYYVCDKMTVGDYIAMRDFIYTSVENCIYNSKYTKFFDVDLIFSTTTVNSWAGDLNKYGI